MEVKYNSNSDLMGLILKISFNGSIINRKKFKNLFSKSEFSSNINKYQNSIISIMKTKKLMIKNCETSYFFLFWK
ncbi:hypothetical protein SAMN05660477_00011 [Soonwooa buanensis]|uniref:Uncharacterized protein n=1 Tax=Soonwooa buanensis TaxID=619805 RepID=A0A1T5CEK8_9FLAO|nr:hypothetical protein SAMN05660477_00011 [Soonwooa buanensis]